MSRSDSYSVIKDVLTWSGRIVYHKNGKSLAKADSRLLNLVFAGQCALLMDLLPDEKDSIRSYSAFICNYDRMDIVLFGKFLKIVDGVIKNYLEGYEQGLRWTYKQFKLACGCETTFWDFIGPIKKILESYLAHPTVWAFRILSQYVNFLSRTNLRSLDFKHDMEQEYIDLETEMGNWEYDPQLLSELTDVLDVWTYSFSVMDFVPKHGPGSIAERKGRPSLGEKYTTTTIDGRILSLNQYVGSIGTLFPLLRGTSLTELCRQSELVCVPKSLTTNRTISKEPCSLQYLQQGVMRAMVSMIRDSEAGRHIDFVHQEKSCDLACEGSNWGDYATIDLSSASDTVTVRLVESIVNNPLLREMLFATRSTSTLLPSGKSLVLNKFAPMGSSVCFPTETLIFAACCAVAVRREGGHKRYYRVYGDDIIISRECVDELLSILDALHFKVNSSKSFYTSKIYNFREACGGEYFNTNEVTPLRVPRKFKSVSQLRWSDAGVVDQYMSFANRAFDFGYMNLRHLLLQELDRLLKTLPGGDVSLHDLPFSTDGRVGVKTYEGSCTNYGVSHRFNRNLYAAEWRCIISHSNAQEMKFDFGDIVMTNDDIAYFEWLRRNPSSEEVVIGYDEYSEGDVNLFPSHSKLSYKWMQL